MAMPRRVSVPLLVKDGKPFPMMGSTSDSGAYSGYGYYPSSGSYPSYSGGSAVGGATGMTSANSFNNSAVDLSYFQNFHQTPNW